MLKKGNANQNNEAFCQLIKIKKTDNIQYYQK